MKPKKIKPDDYYNNGIYEIARFGKVVSMSNNITKEDHQLFMVELADKYNEIVNEIQTLIDEIRDLVINCEPISLLKYCYSNFVQSMMGITSEVQMGSDKVIQGRELEYVQSIIVSNKPSGSFPEGDPSSYYFLISKKIKELYDKIQIDFILAFTAKERVENPETNLEIENFIVESIHANFVRGDRYAAYEKEHLETFLLPHHEIFHELFNLDVRDFIDGLMIIQESLSSGLFSAFSDLDTLMKGLGAFEVENIDKYKNEQDCIDAFRTLISNDTYMLQKQESFINKFIGCDLHDLSILTNWPIDLLLELSWDLGEETTFLNREKYNGWPIIELPVFQKPFIHIGDKFFCFDYYNLFDNIYRVIQRVICNLKVEYKDIWKDIQTDASENAVANLFRELLPGCLFYNQTIIPLKSH